MRKIRLHITDESYSKKPKKRDNIRIVQCIMDMEREIGIETFAREAGENGKLFIPALYDRGKENFLQQEVFALTFSSLGIEEFLSRACKYEVVSAFVYSVSCGSDGPEENPGFCAVFINDCAICDQDAVSVMIGLLLGIFPEADKSCKDNSKLAPGGNGILCKNQGAEINIRDLAVSVQEKMLEEDSHNYARNIKQLGKKLKVSVKKGTLGIHRRIGVEKSEKFWVNSVIITENIRNSSKFYIIEKEEPAYQYSENAYFEKDLEIIQKKSRQDMIKICPLFRNFYEKEIPYGHKQLLASSLVHVKGGKGLFFRGLKERHIRWEIEWKHLKAYMGSPQECRNVGCPYGGQCRCRSLYHKLSSKIRQISDESGYISLEEAEKRLEQSLQNALCSWTDSIHLIKAQTALGKTTAYCKIAMLWRGGTAFVDSSPHNKTAE